MKRFHLHTQLQRLHSRLSLLVAFWFISSCNMLYADSPKTYIVGVVPQYETRQLHAIWRPILDHLENKTGLKLVLHGSPSITDFEKEFLAGKFDFAYMNPYHLAWTHETTGYIPLVRDHSKQLNGILVVHKDSDIQDIRQLDGKIVVFPSPNALGASLMMRADLKDIYKINIIPRYVRTHDSVYLNVALKQAAAGGGIQKTLNQQQPQVRDSLKVLYKTRSVSPHPFSAHPRVSEKVQQQLKDALLEMATTETGREMLSKIPIKQAGPASMDDYTPLTTMGLERFRSEE